MLICAILRTAISTGTKNRVIFRGQVLLLLGVFYTYKREHLQYCVK